MDAVVNKLNYLKETKAIIKNAITEKGVTVSDTDTFRSYANKIGSIKVGSPSQEKSINVTENGSVAVTPDSGYLLSKVNVNVNVASSGGGSKNNAFMDFSKYTNGAYIYMLISSIDVSSFNTRNITDMMHMFSNCPNLVSVDLSSFNTRRVTNMAYMFSNNPKLVSLDLSSFNTSNVTSMGSMFNSCSGLKSLDLSSFNTSKVTSMTNMFNYDSKLETLILGSNWAPHTRITSFDLSSCTSLSHDSLVDIMNKLATRTNSPTIKLSTASKNLLTTSEKAIATGKGWTIA